MKKERKGFLHVLLVPTNDNNWVIGNFSPKHWVKWQEMGENCFLKGKNGQFYSIKWLKYGFSPNRLAELFQYYDFSTKIYLYFDLYVAECQIQFLWLLSRFHRYVYITSFSWCLPTDGIYISWKFKIYHVSLNNCGNGVVVLDTFNSKLTTEFQKAKSTQRH